MSRRVYVCPECGEVNNLWEVYRKEIYYKVLPDKEVVDEIEDDEEYCYVTCGGCGKNFDVPCVDVFEVELNEEEGKAAPVGDFYVQNPAKLADALALAGVKVEVVSLADVE